MKKILRNFRLSPKTIQQIEELSRMAGDADATAIVTQAIQEKHEQFWFANSARLHPRRDGRYDVEKQG
jgi:DNA-binding ferritin-like protein